MLPLLIGVTRDIDQLRPSGSITQRAMVGESTSWVRVALGNLCIVSNSRPKDLELEEKLSGLASFRHYFIGAQPLTLAGKSTASFAT